MYDALNVLMAMDIIGKENKDIFWLGLPSAAVSLADQLQVNITFLYASIFDLLSLQGSSIHFESNEML